MITIFCLLSGQVFAKNKKLEIELKINNLVTSVSNGIDRNTLMTESQEVIDSAKDKDLSQRDFVEVVSEKLGLELSQDELDETIADLQDVDSEQTMTELADTLTGETGTNRLIFAGILLIFLLLAYINGWGTWG